MEAADSNSFQQQPSEQESLALFPCLEYLINRAFPSPCSLCLFPSAALVYYTASSSSQPNISQIEGGSLPLQHKVCPSLSTLPPMHAARCISVWTNMTDHISVITPQPSVMHSDINLPSSQSSIRILTHPTEPYFSPIPNTTSDCLNAIYSAYLKRHAYPLPARTTQRH